MTSRQHTDNIVCECIVQSTGMQYAEGMSCSVATWDSHVNVKQYRLANPLNLGYNTLEVERLGEHDLEDLLHIYRRGC
jgi:hypothetical protein